MATGITDSDSTGMGGLIPEVWSTITRDSLLPNLVFPNIMDRSFESQLSGRAGDTIHVDGVGGTTADTISGLDTANNITLGVGGTLTSEVITTLTQVDIAIDTHAYKFVDLEHELSIFTDFPLMERIASRSAFVVAQKVDDDCAGLVDDFSQTVGTLASPLGDDNFLRAVQYLNDANAQEDGRVAIFSAAEQLEFMKTEKYINKFYEPVNAITADPDAGRFKGDFGSLYGVRCYMSTNVEGTNAAGHDNGMWQKEAIALVMVDNGRVATDYEISTDSHRHAVHSIYGIKEIRDTSGVWLKAK